MASTGYAPVGELRMYCEIHGQGRPLILLHVCEWLEDLHADDLTPAELAYVDGVNRWREDERGYGHVQSSRPQALGLVVDWRASGLTVNFADLAGEDPCGVLSGLAATIEVDGRQRPRWRTLSGLRPGMPESAIAKLYEDAHKSDGDWWLGTETSPIGDGGEYAATVDDGVVSGFELFVGAAGD